MKNLKKLITYVCIALSVAIISCSPEDGKDGAQGPQGEQGTAGQDGQDGNANVIASDWIAVDFGPAASQSFIDIIDSNINAANLNNAVFLIYGQIDSDTIVGIPFVFYNSSYYFGLFASSNTLRLVAHSTDGASQTFGDFSAIRFVIIPPAPGFTDGTSSSDKTLANLENQGIDITNYKEVANHFNLKN